MKKEAPRLALGLDLGAVSVKAVLLRQGSVLAGSRAPHRGDLEGTLQKVLAQLPTDEATHLGITGSRARGLDDLGDDEPLDEIVCLMEGARLLNRTARGVLSVGGERSDLVQFDAQGRYQGHRCSGSCAAGSGLFLEQQAATLDLTPEDLQHHDVAGGDPAPRVASRCAVFARTDLVHLLQEGHTPQQLGWSLCLTVAHGLRETLLRGHALAGPLLLLGGVARIPAMARALEQVLGLRPVVPPDPERAVALGAALLARPARLARLRRRRDPSPRGDWRAPLPSRPPLDRGGEQRWTFEQTEVTRHGAWRGPLALGIDIGSRSTKAALLDADDAVVAGFYGWTEGHALEATQQLLRAVQELARRENGAPEEIRFVGVTGSGRKLVYHALGADLQQNEVTAHARGALHLDPAVDTIFEIGGQDSKFTRLEQGRVVHAELNFACAAGTGSFIEEQARRLEVPLEQVQQLAEGVAAPPTSDRCTVFMERDISRLAADGYPTAALLAAALHAVCENYLNKVVGSNTLGRRIVMQGATALNGALVSALEQRLGRSVGVSRHCHVAGALGVALSARRAGRRGAFRGFELAHQQLVTRQQTCRLCENSCRLTTLTAGGRTTGWGMRCGREYSRRRPARSFDSVLQVQRQLRLTAVPRGVSSGVSVGYPDALYLQQQRPLWQTFWGTLGVELVTVASSPRLLEQGRAAAGVQTCAPAALLLGQALQAGQDADMLFLPTLVRGDAVAADCDIRVSQQRTDACYCFVSQYLPTLLRCRAELDRRRLISPVLSLNQPPAQLARQIHACLAGRLPFSRQQLLRAMEQALHRQRAIENALQAEGRRRLTRARREGGFAVVLLGMPYVLQETLLNLDLPRLLEQRGVVLLLPEMLSGGVDLDQLPDGGTHWQYAKQSLAAAQQVAAERALYAIYLSAFHCGPDALVIPRLRTLMEQAGKPLVVLQLDSQGSDAGMVTRLEAGLETFADHHRAPAVVVPAPAPVTPPLRRMHRRGTFLVPNIDPMICRLWEAAYAGCGYSVYFYDQTPAEVRLGQQYTGGGECLAIPGIIGGAVKLLSSIGAGDRAVFVPTCSYSCVYPPSFPRPCAEPWIGPGSARCRSTRPTCFRCFPAPRCAPARGSGTAWRPAICCARRRSRFAPMSATRAPPTARWSYGWHAPSWHCAGATPCPRWCARRWRTWAASPRSPPPDRACCWWATSFCASTRGSTTRWWGVCSAWGARIFSPPVSDYTLTARLQDRRLLQQQEHRRWQRLTNHLFARSLSDTLEIFGRLQSGAGVPARRDPFEELEPLVSRELDLPWSLGGETLSVLGRVLQAVQRRRVDAVVHVNSLFCQPAYVSEALLEQVLARAGVPLVNVYCDGSGDHTASAMEPLIHHLGQR